MSFASTRARASSTSTNAFPSHRDSTGLGITLAPSSSSISGPSSSAAQQQHRDSYGQGRAHNDGRGSIVALRRATTFSRAGSRMGRLDEDGEAVDESRLDAEEVMKGLSVSEVKRVEARLRSLALSKQQELRTMVGERYRDLLSSSAALGTLFDSSSRLSGGLGKMREVVGEVAKGELGGAGLGGQPDNGVGEELSLLLPLASQTKLLLDSPELIYRFLESSLFLPASYLFSLCRLVHSEISERREEEEEVGRVGALVEGQWETLQGLRSVISDRARLSLRDTNLPAATHTQTLIALIQLDSLSLSSALQLLLSLRLKLLSSLLPSFSPSNLAPTSIHVRHPSEKGSQARSASTSRPRSRPGSRSTSRAPSRSGSRVPSRSHSRAPSRDGEAASNAAPLPSAAAAGSQSTIRKPVREVVKEAVEVIVGTLRLSREIFGQAPSDPSKSTLEALVKSIEEGDKVDPEEGDSLGAFASDGGPKSPNQQKRDSRLATLSLPFSFASAPPRATRSASTIMLKPAKEPLISTRSLLRTLPSSPLLLRYLPRQILDYTPFLVSSSATPPSVQASLSTWLGEALQLLSASLEGLVGQLSTIRSVWDLRAELQELLADLDGVEEAEKQTVSTVLEIAWEGRVKLVWERQLAGLSLALDASLKLKAGLLGSKEGEGDVHPPQYLFSPSIPFPTLNSALAPSSTLPTFRTALRKRVQGRSPLVDAVVKELEGLGEAIREDVGVLKGVEGLERSFEVSARKALDGLVRALRAELEDARSFDEQEGIKRELFLGRVAAHLSVARSFEPDVLVFSPAATSSSAPSSFEASLMDVHRLSLARWRECVVQRAVEELEKMWAGDQLVREADLGYLFKPSTTDMSISVPSSIPSPQVLTTLHSLVCQLQSLGLPPSLPIDQFGLDLYSALAQRVRALDGWQKETGERVKVMDVANLLFLTRFVVREDPDWKDLVSNVAELAASATGTTSTALLSALKLPVLHSLQRTQTLLLPLLSSSATPTPSTNPQQKATFLLPLSVPPPAQGGGEVVSALAVAAPSPRFGLLAVGR